LLSDEWARIAFILLLILSLPIGFHHLYMDPAQGSGWKLLHGFGTFLVSVPTFMTGFTVIASLEIAGRLRGGKGLFGWLAALPWDEPLVLAAGFAMLMLILGGFGGMINASYAMNTMVHNTHWVTAHFHLIFGGVTVIPSISCRLCRHTKAAAAATMSTSACGLWQVSSPMRK
jgi:cytochrome c oxidase subunit 1